MSWWACVSKAKNLSNPAPGRCVKGMTNTVQFRSAWAKCQRDGYARQSPGPGRFCPIVPWNRNAAEIALCELSWFFLGKPLLTSQNRHPEFLQYVNKALYDTRNFRQELQIAIHQRSHFRFEKTSSPFPTTAYVATHLLTSWFHFPNEFRGNFSNLYGRLGIGYMFFFL